MSTNPSTGTSSIRRTLAAFSSRSRRGTPLVRRIEAYAPSQPRPLKSRCVVRIESFSTVAERGGETGLQRLASAARANTDQTCPLCGGPKALHDYVSGSTCVMLSPSLWGDWTWRE